MTKVFVVAMVLAIIGVVAATGKKHPMKQKMRALTKKRHEQRGQLTKTRQVFKSATTPTYVTEGVYNEDCSTFHYSTTYGTNLCAVFTSGGGSVQFLYDSSTGVVSQQLYSDNACATVSTATYNSATVMTTAVLGTCIPITYNGHTYGIKYSTSTSFSLPSGEGVAMEYFATSGGCSSNTPAYAEWASTATFDDDYFTYDDNGDDDDDYDDDFDDDGFQANCKAVTAYSYFGSYINATLTDSYTGGSSSSSKSCFAGSETVTMESGEVKAISEVARGDRVLAADANGNTKFSTVVAVPHAANNDASVFTHITAASGADIKMTEDHLLMVSPACSGSAELMAASTVVPGMCVMTTKAMEKVASVETVNGNGLYTIVTEEEMVVVNGFVASPFATNHAAANAFYNVVRMLPASFLDISIVKRATEIFGAMAASF